MKQFIVLIIIIGIFAWLGWICSGLYIDAMKTSGGLVLARDLVGARVGGLLIGGIIGFFVGIHFGSKFDD
jgi:hypothetical protein